MWEPFLERYDFSRRVKVLSYDELRLRWNEDPEQARRELDEYALVVVDEAHNLRNPNAQRTEAVNALADPDAAAWCPLRCGADTRPRNGGLGAAAEAA